MDGTVFDSSYSVVSRGCLGRVIQGWTEGLQMMAPGAKAKLTIPPNLGYGSMGAPPRIPGEAAHLRHRAAERQGGLGAGCPPN